MTFANVANREKVPLAIGKRVVIELKEEVVFAIADLFNFSQVARFELRVEKDCFIVDIFYVERLGRVGQLLGLKMRGHALTTN